MSQPKRYSSVKALLRDRRGKVNGRWWWHVRKLLRHMRKEAREPARQLRRMRRMFLAGLREGA